MRLSGSIVVLSALTASALAVNASAPLARFQEHVFVVTSDFPATAGQTAALALEEPWSTSAELEPIGGEAIVRHFAGLHYVVNHDLDSVQVIDPRMFATRVEIDTGAGSRPQDVLVVRPDRAYISRHERTHLLRVDPRTGLGSDAVDLSVLADADGLPEMSMMARHGRHLFVQLQRIDGETGLPVAPSLLAVVDLATETLVDVDPLLPGVQGIELVGLVPSFKMQVERATRRLYVSTPNGLLTGDGGIEEIDLVTLRSRGFVTSEAQLGGDLTGFVLVSPDLGYVLTHTDLLLSSHLTAFSRLDGSHQGEKFVTFTQVDNLAFDRSTGQLFFPDSDGVRVFDAASGVQLTGEPIDVGSRPTDMVVARPRPVRRAR